MAGEHDTGDEDVPQRFVTCDCGVTSRAGRLPKWMFASLPLPYGLDRADMAAAKCPCGMWNVLVTGAVRNAIDSVVVTGTVVF